MYPKLLSIYGPFELNSYNAAYIVGITLFIYLADKHPLRARYLSSSAFINLCIESALAGIAGGRVLHVLSSLSHYTSFLSIVSIWDGGLSVLGALFGVLLYGSWFSYRHKAPFLVLTDISALYAPLIHAVGRIGCFLVGCCYGAPTDSFFSVTYTHPQVYAPLGVALHPAQLYSALLYLLLFGILYRIGVRQTSGTLTMWYLIGMSFERFMVDFVRGDRIAVGTTPLSFYQWIALAIGITAVTSLALLHQRTARETL